MRNISVKLFWIWTSGSQKEMLFKDIPIFSSGGHFLTDQNSLTVQFGETNISVKLFKPASKK